jgi:hypothetical protein
LNRRLEGWAGGVVGRLAALAVDARAQVLDEGNLPRVRFVTGSAGEPQAARLVLRIERSDVRAGLELPAVHARLARARLSDPSRALELATAFEVLPEQFTMGESRDPISIDAADANDAATADDLRALLARVESVEHPGAGVWIGWTVPRALALEHSAMLDEQLEDAIAALAQLFALLVADASDLDERAGGKGRRFSGRRPGAGKGDRKKDGESERGDRGARDGRDADARARGRGRDREVEGERDEADPEPARDASPMGARATDSRPLAPSRSPRSTRLPRKPLKPAHVAIERGARVRVLKGPFSGKVGVVHELDGKGGARVMLGLLAVRLEVTNLMPCVEGRGRPVLSSSHRKPIPARS